MSLERGRVVDGVCDSGDERLWMNRRTECSGRFVVVGGAGQPMAALRVWGPLSEQNLTALCGQVATK